MSLVHPCHLGSLPFIRTWPSLTPKSIPETQNPPNRPTFPQTKSVHLRSRFEIAIKPPYQTNKPPSQTYNPRNIYTQTHFSWNSRETRYCNEISISMRYRPNTHVLTLSLCISLYIASFILCVGATMLLLYTLFGFWLYYVCLVTSDCLLVLVWVCVSL